MSRRISYIVLHCTGANQNQSTEEIKRYWKNTLGWENVGYHVIIDADGTYERLAPDSAVTNGVKGHNAHSIHICYKGGWENGKAVDNRTPAQKKTMLTLVKAMKVKYPNTKILGHRDFLVPGKPGWKECPSFDVKSWLQQISFVNQ